MACACKGLTIPMHNARLAINHHVFSTGIALVWALVLSLRLRGELRTFSRSGLMEPRLCYLSPLFDRLLCEVLVSAGRMAKQLR